MTIGIDDFTKDFTPEERAKVAARTAELVEEELTLRDLRQVSHLTQERMAAMGGRLRLVAEFPNRQPVAIALGDIAGDGPGKPSRRGRAAGKGVAARGGVTEV